MSISYIPSDVARQQGHSHIIETLALAYRRGLPIPPAILKAKEVRDALEEIVNTGSAGPGMELPSKAAAVPAAIAKIAAARVQHEHAQRVAAELRPLAAERFIAEIRTVMRDWLPPLLAAFDEHLTAFRNTATAAPHVQADQLAGLDPDSFTAWQDAQAAAYALEAVVEDRRVLAAAFGENYTTNVFGDYLGLVAVVTPPTGERTDTLTREARQRVPELQEISKGVPQAFKTAATNGTPLQGVARWRALLAAEDRGWLRLSLAGLGQSTARVQLVNSWADVVPHLSADAQNQGGNLTQDLLHRAAAAHRTLTPPTPVAV